MFESKWLVAKEGFSASGIFRAALFFGFALGVNAAEVAVIYVKGGDSHDTPKWSDVQAMVVSLNQNSMDGYHYTAYTADTFSAAANMDVGGANWRKVIAEASFSDTTHTFNHMLVDTLGPVPVNELPTRAGLGYWHCGMDGDNRLLNVDDFGNRFGTGYTSITSTGPLSPLSPNFWMWGMATFFYNYFSGSFNGGTAWVAEMNAWLEWDSSQSITSVSYSESITYHIYSCGFLDNQ
jgi:hypothetical protein